MGRKPEIARQSGDLGLCRKEAHIEAGVVSADQTSFQSQNEIPNQLGESWGSENVLIRNAVNARA